jgi:scyllo-inositol 2-dehydrogenase (NADP+)
MPESPRSGGSSGGSSSASSTDGARAPSQQDAEWLAANPIQVGLVGYGLAGRAFHAPVISRVPGLQLTAIVQRSGGEAAQAYPAARIVRSFDELLAIPEICLVVIASPNHTHCDFAKRALQSGRDVLVDKPFATSIAEAVELVKLARSLGRIITVYQNRRYDGDFAAIRGVLASGVLGKIANFETHYDRFRPNLKVGVWREQVGPGNGIWFDIGPHLVDHAMTLFGEPEAITAEIRVVRDNAVADDFFDISLHYPGGLRALLSSSILAAATRPRFVLQGTQGSFVKHSYDPTELRLRAGTIPEHGPWGAEPEQDWGVLTLPDGDGFKQLRVPGAPVDYRNFYANLRDALHGRAELAVPPQWALNVMQVLTLARESNSRHCTVPYTRVTADA